MRRVVPAVDRYEAIPSPFGIYTMVMWNFNVLGVAWF